MRANLGEFLPYLKLAKWVGVGRQTVWGKGEMEAAAVEAYQLYVCVLFGAQPSQGLRRSTGRRLAYGYPLGDPYRSRLRRGGRFRNVFIGDSGLHLPGLRTTFFSPGSSERFS